MTKAIEKEIINRRPLWSFPFNHRYLKMMKLLPKLDAKFVVSSLVGALVVTGVVMAIRALPSNAVTTPVKKVADLARG